MLPWWTWGHCRRADGCGIHLDHREAAPGVLGATRRAPPRLPGLTEHQRHDARAPLMRAHGPGSKPLG